MGRTMTSVDIVVEAASPRHRREAERVAADLDLPMLAAAGTDAEFALRRTETRWELHALAATASGPIYAHFGPPVSARALRGNLLARALGRSVPVDPGDDRPVIADATAGLGGDTWVLAALGYRVVAIERSPVVAVLFEDALRRAARVPETALLAAQITFHRGDARQLLPQLPVADTILLDPMYPSRGKTARKVKAIHALRALVGDDDDAAALLEVARRVVRRRVLVKRSHRSPRLAGPAPSGSIRGSTVRLDIYAPKPLSDQPQSI